jgi:O-methyltransferase involved in polyketide biosynthesis
LAEIKENPFDNGLPGVEWTLLIPLMSRARITRTYTSLLNDPLANAIVERLSGKLSEADTQVSSRDLCMGARARTFDDTIKAYVQEHPHATVVNLGAGFDSAYQRIANAEIAWYDVDLPEVINFRKLLIPETDRSRCVACSILDDTWIREIDNRENGLFIFAAGVLPYFAEEEVKRIIIALADRHLGCEFICDVVSKQGCIDSNRLTREAGFASAPMQWIVNRHNNLHTWDSRVVVRDHYPLFAHIKRTPDLGEQLIRFMDTSDKEWNVSIVHLRIGT